MKCGVRLRRRHRRGLTSRRQRRLSFRAIDSAPDRRFTPDFLLASTLIIVSQHDTTRRDDNGKRPDWLSELERQHGESRSCRTKKGAPTGKLADAELHFTDGAIEGLRLLGFACGSGATAPAATSRSRRATYSVNGERRSFSLLRPIGSDNAAQNAIRDLVLQAYAEFESRAAIAS